MNRITLSYVEARIDTANRRLGFTEPVNYSTVGALALDRAYGGTKVVQYCNDSGGVSTMSQDGHGTLRQAATFLDGFIKALEVTQGI